MKNEHNREKEVFTVPDGYFEQLNKEILKATAGNSTVTPSHKSHFIGRLSRIIGYAAAVAIIFGITANLIAPWHNAGNNTAKSETVYADNEYIDNILNSYTIDEYTFYCYLTDSDFE